MKNRKTYYHLVLDYSGSMESCWNDTVTGLTDQLVSIRQMAKKFPEQEFLVSTCFFNNEVSFPSGIMRSDQIQMPSMENLRPNGCTALFDAIGDSIRKIEFAAGNELKNGEASVVMVILTDGHENASCRFNSHMINEEMKRLKATDLWSFAFVGADFDITATADVFQAGLKSRMNMSKSDMKNIFGTIQDHLSDYLVKKRRMDIKRDLFED